MAACDQECILSYPVETIKNDKNVLTRLAELVAEYEPLEVLLGLPIDLRGEIGPAAQAMLDVANDLARSIAPIPVCLVDERLSSAEAARRIAHTGFGASQQRGIIDQEAAVGILEHAIRTEARTGECPQPLEVHGVD